jgi:hypothetical protein
MACRGCGAKKIRRRKMDDVKATSKNWSAKSDTGFVNLEYVGKNKNELMFKGPSRRRYRFGNNEYHRTGLVHPDDVQHLLRLNCFRVATQPVPSGESAPLHADPSPKPSPVRESTKPLTTTPEHDTLEATGLDLAVGSHSIKELQDIDLTKYDLVTAIRLEKAGKNRKSALALLARAQRRLVREQRKVKSEDVKPKEAEDTPEETFVFPGILVEGDKIYQYTSTNDTPIELAPDLLTRVNPVILTNEGLPDIEDVLPGESVYGDYTA